MKQLLLAMLLGAALAGQAQAQDGAALFGQHCAACHQADASGTVGLAPALKGEHWTRLGVDRNYLASVMLKGVSGPIQVNGQAFVGAMPGLAAQLDDATLAAIATHLRQLQGAGDAPAYTADEFKAARAAPGSAPQTRQRRQQLLGN